MELRPLTEKEAIALGRQGIEKIEAITLRMAASIFRIVAWLITQVIYPKYVIAEVVSGNSNPDPEHPQTEDPGRATQ